MKPVISDIINYFNNQILPEEMEPFDEKIGRKNLKRALEVLFNWLLLQLRLKHSRPLILRADSEHDLNLNHLLINWDSLSAIFEIQDNQLNFKPYISEEERISIKNYVRDHLKPYLFVTTRR